MSGIGVCALEAVGSVHADGNGPAAGRQSYLHSEMITLALTEKGLKRLERGRGKASQALVQGDAVTQSFEPRL